MRVLLALILLGLTASLASPQPPDILWQQTFPPPNPDDNQAISCIVVNDDGTAYAWVDTYVGSPDPSHVIKVDSDGNELWTVSFDSDHWMTDGAAISDGNGGVYVCGSGFPDIRVTHLDADGQELWTNATQPADGGAETQAICRVADGWIAVAGESDIMGEAGVFLALFSANGSTYSLHVFDLNMLYLEVTAIVELSDGNLLIGGSANGSGRSFFLKTDLDGNLLWSNLAPAGSEQEVLDLVALDDGGAAFLGEKEWDLWLGKIDANGEIVMEITDEARIGHSLEPMPDGGFMMGCRETPIIYNLVRLDEDLQDLWSLDVGLPFVSGHFYAGKTTTSGGFYGGGINLIEDELYMVRLQEENPAPVTFSMIPTNGTVIPPGGGTLLFDVHLSSTLANPVSGQGWTMITLPNGQDFGPLVLLPVTLSPGDTWFTGAQQVVPAMAPSGAYVLTGELGLYPNWVALDDQIAFSKQAGTAAGTPPVFPPTTGFLETLSDRPADAMASEASLPERFALGAPYPNPFNGRSSVTVSLPSAGEVRASLVTVTGREVRKIAHGLFAAGTHTLTVDASGLASGSYLLRVDTAGQPTITRKLTLVK